MKIYSIIAAVLVTLGPGPVGAQSLTPDQGQTPSVHLDAYTGKPSHTVAFTGTGFMPNETVDVSLGDQALATITADSEGRILHASIGIPFLSAGDYAMSFVGQTTRKPVGV